MNNPSLRADVSSRLQAGQNNPCNFKPNPFHDAKSNNACRTPKEVNGLNWTLKMLSFPIAGKLQLQLDERFKSIRNLRQQNRAEMNVSFLDQLINEKHFHIVTRVCGKTGTEMSKFGNFAGGRTCLISGPSLAIERSASPAELAFVSGKKKITLSLTVTFVKN